MTPSTRPSRATSSTVCPAASSRSSSSLRLGGERDSLLFQQRRLPTRILPVAVRTATPLPGCAWNCSTGSGRNPRSFAACRMSRPSRCSLCCSAVAAVRSNSSGETPSRGAMSPSSSRPSVRVPVLSKAKAVTPARRSRAEPPLMRMPVPASRPSAAMIAAGVARIRAHGQATTSTDRAGSVTSCRKLRFVSGGRIQPVP